VTRWLDDEQQQAWRAWLDLNAQLSAALHRQLQTSSGLSLPDYDVLVALTDVPERSLRMYELGRQLGWDKSRLSKQVSRMALRGLVQRRECPDDLRGAFVDLTEVGLAAIRTAAPAHVELVQSLVFDGLSRGQVRGLAELSRTLLDRLAVAAGTEVPRGGNTGARVRDAAGGHGRGSRSAAPESRRGAPARRAPGAAGGHAVRRSAS
jgi:DNA-binding MarR family transcriptional regulator